MKKALVLVFFILVTCSGSLYAAKESEGFRGGDLGFTFYSGLPVYGEGTIGSQASLGRLFGAGLDYHPVASLGLEPGILFSYTYDTDKSMSGSEDTSKSLSIGPSLGVFFYKELSKKTYLYTGPRFEFLYGKNKSDNASGSRDRDITVSLGLSAVLGLKHMLTGNLGVFGDLSLGYGYSYERNKTWNSSGTLTQDDKERTHKVFLTRTLLGVAIYF